MRLTVNDVMAWEPCDDYPREVVVALWAGREALTPGELAELDIPPGDRAWGLIRCLLQMWQRLFACECADRALTRERDAGREPDPRSWAVVEVARRHAWGEATAAEMAAASAATRPATQGPAWGPAWAARAARAARAASAAVWAAAWSAREADGGAADAATWAAESAADAARLDAAGGAWAAAQAAERAWQIGRLLEMIDGLEVTP